MELSIRDALVDDYQSVFELIRDELGYQHIEYTQLCDRLRKMESGGNHRTIVAAHDGRVVGFIGVVKGIAYNYEGEYLQILAMAVSSSLQGKGVGSRLLTYVEEYAAQNGLGPVVLTSNKRRFEAHSFYEKNGYTNTSIKFSKDIQPTGL